MKERIIINMPVKNGEKTLRRAIESILNQKAVKREVIIVIANDNSSDKSKEILETYAGYSNIIVLDVVYGKSYLVRNHLLEYSKTNIKNYVLIGRLDCDDYLLNDYVLSEIEKRFDKENFDVFIAGNKQEQNGLLKSFSNQPSNKFFEVKYIKNRLEDMSKGVFASELPSCNTFIGKNVKVNYPKIDSAEDHWFLVELLLLKDKLKITIDSQLIYCVYSLDGELTEINRINDAYVDSRLKLLKYYTDKIND